MFVFEIFSAWTRLTEKKCLYWCIFSLFLFIFFFLFYYNSQIVFFTSYEIQIQIPTVAQLSRNNLLSNKQYEICTAASTADVLSLHTESMTHSMIASSPKGLSWIYQKLLTKFGIRFLPTHSSYGIFGRVCAVTKYFLSSTSMKLCVNRQSFETHGINEGVPQSFLFCHTLFSYFINDLLKNILTSPVNIYTDDSTIYGGTSKNKWSLLLQLYISSLT